MSVEFYKGKKIFITGHTGFKGTWLSKILIDKGAIVKGYALEPEQTSLYKKIDLGKKMQSCIGDIRNLSFLQSVLKDFKPDIVFHLAAQPIVRLAYQNPVDTYTTNVIGTVNILEGIRHTNSVKSFVNVTTDKVYENHDTQQRFQETDRLNGQDPYANSKSCSELVTSSYQKSFFDSRDIGISTVRAGNVIGGGDFAKDRMIPDCVRAAKKQEKILVRNPAAIRPYQHVLEALYAYLMIAQKQYEDKKFAGSYNIGPNDEDIISNKTLVNMFCQKWGENLTWEAKENNGPFENTFLQIDCTKIKNVFGWSPKWNIQTAIDKIIEFEKWDENTWEICMEKQIQEYMQKNEN